ncbi:MAG: UDP-N-acetylmuramoyl-tripeptide--D-alanyl-D-alanine ligase [Spirochaetaceae bacterium]|nr:UDP-N-acetylmuramoyl-tripeptide--D-alanyl-D-alanine ligase [Spirochaetaceae bacterium]
MIDVQGGAPQNEQSLMTLSEVLKAVDGKLLSKTKEEEFCFSGVACDSRKVEKNFIFFPLVNNQDGHDYIPQAIENGASVIFVTDYYADFHNQQIKDIIKTGVAVISVGHTMYALQRLAASYVLKFPSLIRIGITGSSGKTTTKEIAVNVLSQKFSVVYNEGNLNSETGLPLSVFKIRQNHQVGIFEMGMNRKGEIAELASVLYPQYGIITNVGTAHIGILGTRQAIAEEKKQIFKFFNSKAFGYIPSDDDFADFLAESKGNIKKVSQDFISDVKFLGLEGTSFNYKNQKINFSLCGKYNLKNALSVIALAEDLGLSSEEIKTGLETVKTIFGRNQIVKKDFTFILDCYNANPDSMKASVEFCSEVECAGKKVFVLADMLELGDESEKSHKEIAELVEKSSADYVIFFGEEMSKAKSFVTSKKLDVISTSDENAVGFVAKKLKDFCSKDDIVLLKGSRGMKLERIVEAI